MADESRADDVEKLLADEKAFGDRKKNMIAALLKQREAAIKDFDEKLAKLGYQSPDGMSRRSHHKKPRTSAASAPAAKDKKT